MVTAGKRRYSLKSVEQNEVLYSIVVLMFFYIANEVVIKLSVYRLTTIGLSIAGNPNNNDTPTLKVANFLYRHGYQASDDMIEAYTGVTKYEQSRIVQDKKTIIAVG